MVWLRKVLNEGPGAQWILYLFHDSDYPDVLAGNFGVLRLNFE